MKTKMAKLVEESATAWYSVAFVTDGGWCLGRSSKHLHQRVRYSLVVYVYACVRYCNCCNVLKLTS